MFGVGLSATPTPGDAEPRTRNPVELGFYKRKTEFSQVKRFLLKLGFPWKGSVGTRARKNPPAARRAGYVKMAVGRLR